MSGLTLALASLACGEEAELPPGLLLVTVDSLRADFLSCYGGAPGVGERICELGETGTRYAWAFSPSPSSAPALASILTSHYPSEHGVDASAATFLSGEHTTVSELLRRGGFRTAAFVSSPELNRSRNLQQGFDVYDDRTSPAGPGRLPTRSASDTTDAALAWLEGTTAPWFMWVHYREPHGPYGAAPSPVDEVDSPGARERLRVLPVPGGRGGIPSYQAIPGLFTLGAYEARYRAEIRAVDAQVGRLLDAALTREEPVGVALTADHGEAFGEDRYYLSHGHSTGIEQIRVPLFWRAPKPAAAEPVRVVVSTLDLLPTLLRAAGLATPDSIEGWVLPSPDAPPGAPEQARAVFAEHPERVAVVSGTNYYSRRDDPALSAPETLTLEYLEASAAQTAQLGADGLLPRPEPARPAGITPLLEPRLASFLEGSPERDFHESGSAFPKVALPDATAAHSETPTN